MGLFVLKKLNAVKSIKGTENRELNFEPFASRSQTAFKCLEDETKMIDVLLNVYDFDVSIFHKKKVSGKE